MKSLILKFIVFLFAISIQISCVDDVTNECYFESQSYAIGVSGPETATVNQEISFEVTYLPIAGCTSFLKYNETTADNIHYINITSKSEECFCETDPVAATAIYTATLTAPGEYTFRFKSSSNESIIKNVTVE